MKNWKKYPLSIEYCDLNNSLIDSVISIDETGTPILNNRDVLFTLTGIMIKKEDINLISEKILCLKKKFWEHGQFKDKRVVFHSRDIRKKVGPYNPNIINYNVFIDELYDLISYSIYSTIRNNKSNPLFEQINDKIIYSGIKQFP